MKTGAVLLFIISIFCLSLVHDSHAFRCGNDIVGTGDSKASVLIKCGKPTYQDKVGAKKSTRTKGLKRSATEKQIAHDTQPPAAMGVERWYYNCGKNDFIYVLTFERGVVAHIDTDGRGRGASECLGR